ncbi:MAG: glycosyltransferase family 39 protein [Patescibacteria group bacterium]|nr:glycosyltransferase family 39 protein [Patescibacteria group bacterium]
MKEIKNWSKLFKILFFSIFAIYFSLWIFTVYLSTIQKEQGISPILPVLREDSQEYASLSESIISGNGFVLDGKVETLRAPGYPSFLAVFRPFGGYFTITFIQIILVFLISILIKKLGELFFSKKVGEVSAIIFLLNPVVVYLSLVILTDILFLFLFLLGFYLIVSSNRIVMASLLFGLAIYVRPMGVFALPIFLAPLLISKLSIRDKLKSVVVMIFIIFMIVLPWIARNYKLTGVADFTSFKAINLAYYAVPLFLSHINHTSVVDERMILEKEIRIPQEEWKNLRYSKQISDVAQKVILAHPFSYLIYHTESSIPFLFSSPTQEVLNTYRSSMNKRTAFEPGAIYYLVNKEWKLFFNNITKDWWKMVERIFMLFVYSLALFGFWKNRRNLNSWVFLLIPVYLMLLAGPAGNARYAIQALPFILILFSYSFWYIIDYIYETD